MADLGIPAVTLNFQVFDPLDFSFGREADGSVESMAKRPVDAASRASSDR